MGAVAEIRVVKINLSPFFAFFVLFFKDYGLSEIIGERVK